MILWKKELCTKFCGVLISGPEVMKLQSSEFGVSNVMPANVQKNSSVVFFAFFLLILWKINLLHSFMVALAISHELVKLRNFE